MIDPDVRMVDLSPDGFAHIALVLASRARRGGPELHVLVDDGTIVRAVETSRGVLDGFDGPLDPALLLATWDVSRVIVADVRALEEFTHEVNAYATADRTQIELLWFCAEAFWSRVETAPDALGPSRLREIWARIPRDCTISLVAEPVVSMRAVVRGGRIVAVTSPADPDAEILLRCAVDDLDAILLADDPVAALRDALPRVTHRGLTPLL